MFKILCFGLLRVKKDSGKFFLTKSVLIHSLYITIHANIYKCYKKIAIRTIKKVKKTPFPTRIQSLRFL